MGTEGDSTISPKLYPFMDKDSYDTWKKLFDTSRQRRYQHPLPKAVLIGNHIFSRDLTEFGREYFPIEDSRWKYINNEADADIWSTMWKSKAKFWRSPSEIFSNPDTEVAFPTSSVAEIKDDPHADTATTTKMKALLSYRFDGFSGDLAQPRYGLKSMFLNCTDDTDAKAAITKYPARTRAMLRAKADGQLFAHAYITEAMNFDESCEDFFDDLYLDDKTIEEYEAINMRGTHTSNIMQNTGVKNNPIQKPFSNTFQSITLDHFMHPIYIRPGRLNNGDQVLAHTITFDMRVKYDFEALFRIVRVAPN